jgi:O-antigen ligase
MEVSGEIFGYIEIAGVMCAAAWWYFDPGAGFWPALICLGLWGCGILGKTRYGWAYRIGSPLDVPIAAFLLTGGVALWATFVSATQIQGFPVPVGPDKFWLLIGSVLVYYTLARSPSLRSIRALTALCGLLSAIISIYFLLSTDFSSQPEKFHFVHQVGLLVQKVQPPWKLPAPQPNWAGGIIAMFLPGIIESLRLGYPTSSRRKRAAIYLGLGILLCIAALGIVLSSSRGAWIALSVGLAAWAGIWFLDRSATRSNMDRKAWDRTLGIILLVVGICALALIFLFGGRILSLFPPLVENESYFLRPDLQKTALLLVKDYPFTGSGLGTFPLVFSSYTLLINVPAIMDAHNIFLDLAISQGFPGLFCWLVILAGTIFLAWQARINRREKYRLPLGGACVMLIVMLIHGLVEDPYYDSRAVLFWLIPAGLIAAQARLVETRERPFIDKTRLISGLVVVGIGAILLAGILFLPAWRAAYLANLGAISQTRIEMSAYDPDHFDTLTLDMIRRQTDLSRAEGYYLQALKVDPEQVTALQRLADLALSRKDYEQALTWLRQAAAVDPGNRVTRLLLGDALIANGQPGEAAALVTGLPFSKGRFSGEGWFRYHLDGDLVRENWAYQANQEIK